MGVDPEVVDYVASLAKLYLDEGEREILTAQMGRILEYVDQLQEVDVNGVPPTQHVTELTNVSREDLPRPSLPREASLANAPESALDHFVVPRVLPS